MTIRYDNTAVDERLAADWGFAAWIEYGGHVVLFDTGANGSILLDNMEALGLDPLAVEIAPGLHTTGEVRGREIEQSLVVETGEGQVVVTGCAHPGILNMVGRARQVVAGQIALVVGGFHLGDADGQEIERIVDGFREYGVRQVSPTHCTGARAKNIFRTRYGEDSIKGGAAGLHARAVNGPWVRVQGELGIRRRRPGSVLHPNTHLLMISYCIGRLNT